MECPVLILLSVLGVSSTVSTSVLDNLHYVGCYDSSFSVRKNYHHHLAPVSLTKCVKFCKALKTLFAGVEVSDNFCYCGADIAEESIRRNDSLCNVPCPDESLRTCGGDWLLSLYNIGGEMPADKSDDVDFLIGLSTGVRLYHTNSTTYDTLMNTDDWAYNVDYHFFKNLLFVYSKKKIYKGTLEPKRSAVAATPTVIKEVSTCDGFAVDWVNDRIYWADCNQNTMAIMAMGLDGKALQTVSSLPELVGIIIKRMEVDPYKGVLFWLADGVAQSWELSGKEGAMNISGDGVYVRALALDLRQRRVFYVGTFNHSTSLYSTDYLGDNTIEHFSTPQMKSVYGLGVLGDQVFWVNYANVRDVIYQTILNITSTEDVKMLKTIERAVWHMRVVHPTLQMRPKIDPCLDKGCTHDCVTLGHLVAQCECPTGMRLNDDGVSCYVILDQDSNFMSAGMVLIGFLMIIFVLLVSLLLVYVGDMYWSLLENKLFGIQYSRSSGRVRDMGVLNGEVNLATITSEDNTSEDNVHLI